MTAKEIRETAMTENDWLREIAAQLAEINEARTAPQPFIVTSKVSLALDMAARYGCIDGKQYQMWLIDQMVRALTGDGYAQWVKYFNCNSAVKWDTGSAP
jgi:hypothetical protein